MADPSHKGCEARCPLRPQYPGTITVVALRLTDMTAIKLLLASTSSSSLIQTMQAREESPGQGQAALG